MENFIGPVGLNLLCQILEINGAKVIIKKEFNMPNQEAGTSVDSNLNSLSNIHITTIHIITKLDPRNILDEANLEKVCLNNISNTQVRISIGITVINVFKILNVKASPPTNNLEVEV